MKLLIKDDSGKTTTVNLARDEITIGRKDGNTIRLTEKNVSRTHARFLKKGEEIHIEDLSRYGTRVNGERINRTRQVGAGDLIVIGDYQLSLEGVKAVEEVAPVAAVPAAAPAVDPAKAKKKAEIDAAARERIMAAKREMGGEQSAEAPPQLPPKREGPARSDEERKSRGAGKKRIGAQHPTLVAVTTHLAGTEYPIEQETVILGRTGENDLKVDHHSISRNHAKVVVKDGQVRMVDLQSKNGIRVNGEFWEESILKSGDIIELGKVQFRFVSKGEEFVFRPEDYAEEAKLEEEFVVPSSTGKTMLFVLLLAAAGALVAVYFLVFNKPTEVTNVAVAPPTTPVQNVKVEPTPEPVANVPTEATDAAAADAAPSGDAQIAEAKADPQPEAAKVDHSEAIAKHVVAAQAAATEKRWDDAKQALGQALALDGEHGEAKALSARVASESNVMTSLAEARGQLSKGELLDAWKTLQTLESTPADSVYAAEVAEARTAVGNAIASQLVAEARTLHTKKSWNEAITKAEEALIYVPNHADALDAIAKARRARLDAAIREQQAAQKEAKNNPRKDTKPKETKPKEPAASAKSADELYKEARALHHQDPAAALKLYEQAVAKGYAVAYKMIGSIKITRGDNAGAIAAYKAYLKNLPGAKDADTIKDIIARLGGTP